MKTVAVVAWREIVEYRTFVWAALAALVVTLVVPLVPGFFGWSPAEIREVLMWGMALGFAWLGAVFLGASTVSGTVANGRFGFFMARPLSSPAIWFGKLLGVMTILLVCEVVVLVPAAVLTNPEAIASDLASDLWAWLGFMVGIPLLLMLVAHAVSTMWRGRTVWIGLDLLALVTVGTMGWTTVSALLTARAELAATVVGVATVGAVIVVIVGAGAGQVSAGRCDPRRHHHSLSRALWPALLVLVASLAGYGWWLRTPGIEDLRCADGGPTVSPAGDWIAVTGLTRGRWDVFGNFALNLDSRRGHRLGIGSWSGGTALAFSGNGQRAAWTVPESGGWRIRLGAMDGLHRGSVDSAVFLDHQPRMVLSRRGERVAMIEEGNLVVSTLPEGDLVGSVRLPAERSPVGPYFASDDSVGIFAIKPAGDVDGPPSIRALEFDLDDRKMVEIGVLPDAGNLFSATLDTRRNRWLLGMELERHARWRYVDGRTFSDVSWAREAELGPVVSMLADGRLVRLVNESGSSHLEVLSPEGDLVGEVHLPQKPKRLTIGFQPTPSTLVVAVNEEAPDFWWFDGWDARLVDLESAVITEIGSGIVPANWWVRRGNVTRPLPTGCAASRLFIGSGSSLWLWDQATGKLEQLVAGRW